jgi:hypothetical protein
MTTFWIIFIYFAVGLVFTILFGHFCVAGRGLHVDPDIEHADVDELAQLEIEKLRQERYRRAS